MRTIRVLSDQMINQIAAGEVVENPASVVKELVENALDAGATQIVIEAKGGGLQLIRIIDNGCGMSPDDALLSLERHATSKLSSPEDLFALTTMGFRGEALASIASISKLTLLTAQEVGCRIEVEGGKVLTVAPCARTRGTTFEIRSLFYNVPARKKFQKSAAICSSEISRVVALLSLAHPKVGFELILQERPALTTRPQAALLPRIGEVLGAPFAEQLLPIECEENGLKLSGFIGSREQHRHNRSGQYLYINRRPVHSPSVGFAVRDGYSTSLPSDRHPIFVLHVEIDAAKVDVNVHPQKREVRIREEVWLKEAIRKGVCAALEGGRHHPFAPVFQESPFPLGERVPAQQELSFAFREEEVVMPISFPVEIKPRVVGVYAHFLFLENSDGKAILVDLHAARARIAFDQIVTCKQRESQSLLVPLIVEASMLEAQVLLAHLPLIEELGIGIRLIGEHTFMIDALPSFLDPEDVEDLLRGIGEELKRDWKGEKKEKLALLAVGKKSKKSFSIWEAEQVYEALLKTDSPYFAPDGKAAMAYIGKEEVASLLMHNKRG